MHTLILIMFISFNLVAPIMGEYLAKAQNFSQSNTDSLLEETS